MIDSFLQAKLDRVVRRQRHVARWRGLAASWALGSLLAAILVGVERLTGARVPGAFAIVALVALGCAIALTVLQHRARPDYRRVAQRIENAFPELNGVLLTAVEQASGQPDTDFLRHRLVREAIARSQDQDWAQTVPARRLAIIHAVHLAALACLAFSLMTLGREAHEGDAAANTVRIAGNVTVSPGNVTLEKGETLVVLARFGRALPAGVTMVVRESGAAPRSVPLVKSLADPLFGTSVTNVQQDFTYQLDYGTGRSPEFAVKVFEHPKLVRADAALTYPGYTKLPPRHIEDTTRVSAVEGTHIDLSLQLNKPVRTAQLVQRNAPKATIALTPDANSPRAVLNAWVPHASGTYDLILVDADGRKNKAPSAFVFDVQPNRPPRFKVASPRGDVRPSALEELSFSGTVWDDFGTLAYGIAYTLPNGATKSIELGRDVAPTEKKEFKYLLSLEALGAAPDDLISWNVWADDIGPDGKVRHTAGDLFFAEVRPFDEVFRESQMPSEQDRQSGGGGGAMRRLTDLQRQIVSATWKLRRDGATASYGKDVDVVRQSQEQVLTQARGAAQQARAPKTQALWQGATEEMEKAITKLRAASGDAGQVANALPPEQAAYQALLKLEARETSVSRGRRGGGGGGAQANQRQIDQLDLQQAENRYETQRQARAPQNQQRQEELAILNRLQDLARRQQDLNDRLKELQTALQEAKTEAERQPLRERLKRLEDEQRQMLADADELRQRMDQPPTQSELGQQRQQLDQARDQLQQAADATGQGQVGQALASGTRAQRQLQQARDDLRQQSSSQLADDLRDMRGEARDVSRRQEELERSVAGGEPRDNQRKSLGGDTGDPRLAQQLSEQKERWNRLLDRARQVSEQAESSEPLVSKHLYDSVRKATQADDASVTQLQQDLVGRGELTYDLRQKLQQLSSSDQSGKALDLANQMLRGGNSAAASESVHRASAEVDELRRGVESAAESVLGDDIEQLKLARSELDRLADQLEKERQSVNDGRGDASQRQPGADQQQKLADQNSPRSSNDTTAKDQSVDRAPSPRADASSRSAQRGRGTGARNLADASRPNATNPASARDRGAHADDAEGSRERGPASLNSQSSTVNSSGRGDNPRGVASTDSSGRLDLETLLNGGATDGGGGGGGAAYDDGTAPRGPLTGADFGRWMDGLRNVEQLLDSPDLRDAVANARERARLLRRDYMQSRQKPDWAVVELQVLHPLVEVRQRIAEELARHNAKDSLAPIDHDPVPNRFAEAVRRYYEELGRDAPVDPMVNPPRAPAEPR